MTRIIFEPSRSFNQFRLLTGKTNIGNVMSKVSLRTKLCRLQDNNEHLHINIPLISAAMQAVSGKDLSIALAQLGGISVIPCSIPIDEQVRTIKYVKRFKAGFQDNVITVSKDDKISTVISLMKEKGYGNCKRNK